MPYLDTMKGTSLAFLDKIRSLPATSKILPADVKKSMNRVQQLQAKWKAPTKSKTIHTTKKVTVKSRFKQLSRFTGWRYFAYNNYSKECHYYAQQLKEYKPYSTISDQVHAESLYSIEQGSRIF